jgi:hypothetical protein
MRKVLFILLAVLTGSAFAQSPVIFYTDLTSGPNSGGEGGKGAYVTIYGENFGATQGSSTVTLNCVEVDAYKLWSDTKIVVQIGASAKTGDFVVNVPNVGISNGMAFTVRAGNIKCVSTAGGDANPGTFAGGCYRTIPKARDNLRPGDIAYILNGANATVDDGQGWCAYLAIGNGAGDLGGAGTTAAPKAIVAYPGATVTIGDPIGKGASSGTCSGGSNLIYAIRSKQDSNGVNWVFAGLNLIGPISAMEALGNGWRIVGNDITCPNGDAPDACVESSSASNIKFLGNNVHDVGKAGTSGSSKLYHGVYFSTDSNHIEAGWNTITNVNGCRGMQFHSSGGNNQFDLLVHDNVIQDIRCDGLNFATVDPSKGPVRAWNNVIIRAGRGPDPPDGAADYACVYSAGITNAGAAGSGNIELYNNTLVDCGSGGNGGQAAVAVDNNQPKNLKFLMINNIISQTSLEPYVIDVTKTQITGSNNMWTGSTFATPTQTSGNVLGPALFVSGTDLRLQSSSAAIDAGISNATISSTVKRDKDGVSRPRGAALDLGAYEVIKTGTLAPPSNTRGTVQ